MQLYFDQIVLFLTLVFTGLSVGLFYAWQVSVIPGTKLIRDKSYLETMQSINREILNPAFFLIFFGSMIGLILSSILMYSNKEISFLFILSSTISYIIGPMGITVLGNVPLNDKLDRIYLKKISSEESKELRISYEGKWNKYHLLRTVFAIISFLLLTVAFIN